MNHTPARFDQLFEGGTDPWGFETRWYEERKRDLTLASLPLRTYRSAYEPGCANGVLTTALASRCQRVLGTDGSPRAVDLARSRLAAQRHVEIRQAWLPDEWPEGTFDLIVISELGYFLGAEALRNLALRASRALSAEGTLLACHWRWQSTDCDLDGASVHAILGEVLAMPVHVQTQDKDFLLTVWCHDPRSVAQREGLFTQASNA